ncbi:MAG: hypothetical protein A2133_00790 [Actinobacteria bacterium RBG_16_64_13]|nr:MAG: hypothetical protein A2133_00790 [Actinobacteria bacterium RBG_16_64_13]
MPVNTIHGIRNEDGTVSVLFDGRPLIPHRSQQVWNHSPGGFEWGYGGSGPAQLALGVLLEALSSEWGSDDRLADIETSRALRVYQTFKQRFLENASRDGFRVECDILKWALDADLP